MFRRAVHTTARGDYTPEQLAAWAPEGIGLDDWSARRRAAPTVVAELDGRVAGFADLDAGGHIGMLYVDPDVARTGVASALLAHLTDLAGQRGLGALTADVSITARPFFARHGFVVLREQRPVRGRTALTNYRMRRELPGDDAAGP